MSPRTEPRRATPCATRASARVPDRRGAEGRARRRLYAHARQAPADREASRKELHFFDSDSATGPTRTTRPTTAVSPGPRTRDHRRGGDAELRVLAGRDGADQGVQPGHADRAVVPRPDRAGVLAVVHGQRTRPQTTPDFADAIRATRPDALARTASEAGPAVTAPSSAAATTASSSRACSSCSRASRCSRSTTTGCSGTCRRSLDRITDLIGVERFDERRRYRASEPNREQLDAATADRGRHPAAGRALRRRPRRVRGAVAARRLGAGRPRSRHGRAPARCDLAAEPRARGRAAEPRRRKRRRRQRKAAGRAASAVAEA